MKRYEDLNGFSGQSFFMVNNDLIRALGDFTEAGILSKLINISSSPSVFQYRDEHDDYFFVTIDRLQQELCMGEAQQRAALTKLEEKGLIDTVRMGVPPKRHFKLNTEAICRLVNAFLEAENARLIAEENAMTKEEFYENLSNSIYEGFDSFKVVKDNMEKKFALPLYVYTRALYKYHGIKIAWDGATYGKFKNITKAYVSNFDYRQFLDILKSPEFASTKPHLWVLKDLKKITPPSHFSQCVLDPRELPEWADLK